MEGLIFLIVILAIVFLYWIAVEFHAIAEMKGFSESKYLWIPFLFPIAGYLLVIALPDRSQSDVTETKPSAKQTSSDESDELPDL